MRKILVLAALCIPMAGCAGLMGSKAVSPDVSVAYTLDPASGQASFSATSGKCGKLASGVVNVDKGAAACVAVNEGTTLVGQVQGK